MSVCRKDRKEHKAFMVKKENKMEKNLFAMLAVAAALTVQIPRTIGDPS